MKKIITDANSIVAKISHKVTEYSSIYPIMDYHILSYYLMQIYYHYN